MAKEFKLQDVYGKVVDEILRENVVYEDLFTGSYIGNSIGEVIHIPTMEDVVNMEYDKAKGIDPNYGGNGTIPFTDFSDYAINEVLDEVNTRGVDYDAVGVKLRMATTSMAEVVNKKAIGVLISEGTDTTVKGTDIFEKIVNAGAQLSLNKIPHLGRKVLVSPQAKAELLLDRRFIAASAEELKSGFIGRAAGFEVYEYNGDMGDVSFVVLNGNYVVKVDDWIVKPKVEEAKSPYIGAYLVNARKRFGFKVVKPEAVLVIKETSTK